MKHVKETEKNYLIWNGQNLEDIGINPNDFTTSNSYFKEFENSYFKSKNFEPKDEFETEKEFQERKESFIKLRLNNYLGSQKIEMKYNPEPEDEFFNVSTKILNIDFNFKIEIPRKIAREFKQEVSFFDFNFTQDLVLDSISVNFQNQLFYAKDFNKDILIKIEREREISSKTVQVDNLMFQDFDLPNRMNWDKACDYCEKLKLLGFTDWRLPELEELKIAYQNKSKFKNIENGFYWSNTVESNSSNSWILYFNGGSNGDRNQSNDYFVRCVR